MPSSTPPASILVYEHLCATMPGAGSAPHPHLLRQGRAMRDAMLADLDHLAAPAALRVHCAVAAGGVEAALPAGVQPQPLSPDATAADWLAAAAHAGHFIWAVAPETEGILESLARAVPDSRWLGCSADAIALAASKRATTQHLAAHGLPVPALVAGQARRWVVKLDDGAGATDTRVHDHLQAARTDAAGRPTPAIVEPWVEGEALSLSVACRAGQAPRLLSVNRQHVEVDAHGVLHFHGVTPAACPLHTPQASALQALAARIARAIAGLNGYVGIDLVWHPHLGPVVIEVNPRLTTAYVGLSTALGVNVARLVLPSLAG